MVLDKSKDVSQRLEDITEDEGEQVIRNSNMFKKLPNQLPTQDSRNQTMLISGAPTPMFYMSQDFDKSQDRVGVNDSVQQANTFTSNNLNN